MIALTFDIIENVKEKNVKENNIIFSPLFSLNTMRKTVKKSWEYFGENLSCSSLFSFTFNHNR